MAAVDGGCNSRCWGSRWGFIGSPVHSASCILWCAIPASGFPAGTCILIRKSISQRASSRMSGTPLSRSGTRSSPSPSSADSASGAVRVRSYVDINWATEMPPLTTYLPWSPASYQPPDTSSR